jgi:DUF971 family protein
MNTSVIPPQKVAFKKGEFALSVTWKNGESSTISGEELRRYCACSECRARNVVGISIITESSKIETVGMIGGQALQATFIDGHDKGIYPWPYLYAISKGRAMAYLSE